MIVMPKNKPMSSLISLRRAGNYRLEKDSLELKYIQAPVLKCQSRLRLAVSRMFRSALHVDGDDSEAVCTKAR